MIAVGTKTLSIASSSPSLSEMRKIPEIRNAKKTEINRENRLVVKPTSSVA
jgi:hypothetical protein